MSHKDNSWDKSAGPRLVHALPGWSDVEGPPEPFVIGVLPGEGIGPEIIGASLALLNVIQSVKQCRFDIRWGGKIGLEAQKASGQALNQEVVQFCESIFRERGAIFCGPGGGRFVYDLRRQFDLYCKIVPVRPIPAVRDTGTLRPEIVDKVDMLIIREATGGLYFGECGFEERAEGRRAHHRFYYDEQQVARILRASIRLAQMRRKRLHVVTKLGGATSISELWQQQAERLSAGTGVKLQVLDVDTACYFIVADAGNFDVVVAPNMFGDVLADSASLLLGSRGISYSANYADHGVAVYQTGHGAAYDLVGINRANPLGQILSLAMMLRESFGLAELASQIEMVVNDTLAQGWRTRDIMARGCTEVGTRELGQRIAQQLCDRLTETTAAAAHIPIALRACE